MSLPLTPSTSPTDNNLRYNSHVYLFAALLCSLTYAFGDPTYLMPGLALRLQAPAWLVALPNVVNVSIAYLPVIYMGWLLGTDVSRKKLCALWAVLQVVPLLFLAAALYCGGSNTGLLITLAVCSTLYSLTRGFNILPCWDLFAHLFPANERGGMMGKTGAVGQVASMLAAGGTAWLIGAHSTIAYPRNYALALLVFIIGILLVAWTYWILREPPVPLTPNHGSFGDYCRDLKQILNADRPFMLTLSAAAIGAAINASPPLFLVYAQRFGGFDDDMLPRLIAIRPYFLIMFSLTGCYMTQWIGSHRVAAIAISLTLPAVVLLKWMHGPWQLAPLVMAEIAGSVYTYSLLAVMHQAQPERRHQYIALFYSALILPATAPLWLGYLMDSYANATLVILASLAVIGAIVFYLADPRRHEATDFSALLTQSADS